MRQAELAVGMKEDDSAREQLLAELKSKRGVAAS